MLATDRQTDRRTDGQAVALSRSRCRERRLNNENICEQHVGIYLDFELHA